VDFSPKPYRVERRLHIGQPWMLVEEADSHSDALALARGTVKQYDGYARVIVQHVIERFDHGMLRRARGSRRRQAAA
jgi:hypothetical protein